MHIAASERDVEPANMTSPVKASTESISVAMGTDGNAEHSMNTVGRTVALEAEQEGLATESSTGTRQNDITTPMEAESKVLRVQTLYLGAHYSECQVDTI
jgi:hypothetical protein